MNIARIHDSAMIKCATMYKNEGFLDWLFGKKLDGFDPSSKRGLEKQYGMLSYNQPAGNAAPPVPAQGKQPPAYRPTTPQSTVGNGTGNLAENKFKSPKEWLPQPPYPGQSRPVYTKSNPMGINA